MTDKSVNALRTAAVVDQVISLTGGIIRLGLPLGLGKPNHFVNALYQRAYQNENIQLEIYTALSLGRPRPGTDLEKRFLGPFIERVFADYEELDYLQDLRRNNLPANVGVYEFFFQPGSMLGNSHAQRHYISSNYTHVARDLNARRVNVVAQMVAPPLEPGGNYSLSCNPEVSLDLKPLLEQRRQLGETIVAVGQLHHQLPWMGGDAAVDDDFFDFIIEDPDAQSTLFSTPNMPVTLQDHFVGMAASTLIRDNGLLQIGIGALGDALVHHACRRDKENLSYRQTLQDADIRQNFANEMLDIGGEDAFEQGLYGCSEMFTHGLMHLIDQNIIRRPVYQDKRLQQYMTREWLEHQSSLRNLDVLVKQGVISQPMTVDDVRWLSGCGLLPQGTRHAQSELVLPDDTVVINDLNDPDVRDALQGWMGAALPGGTIMDAGFFLGPTAFYQRLTSLEPELRNSIRMMPISTINHLYGDEHLKRLQRGTARFVNSIFTATLLGAAVSDQLEDGRVLSGVGGQYNFVSQAHELEDARSVLMLRAWRERGAEAASNIVFSYGHQTIPRHLRDVFVTEYGIADVRGKPDNEVVAAMLAIADSRFQPELLEQAKQAGKIAADYQLPEKFRYNTPQRLESVKQRQPTGVFPLFPLGADFDETEQRLMQALGWLKQRVSRKAYFSLGRKAILDEGEASTYKVCLERMKLDKPTTLRERLYRRLLLTALQATE